MRNQTTFQWLKSNRRYAMIEGVVNVSFEFILETAFLIPMHQQKHIFRDDQMCPPLLSSLAMELVYI